MRKSLVPMIMMSLAALAVCSCGKVSDAEVSREFPPIWPDYTFVTVPRNIAPLNFGMADSVGCDKMRVTVESDSGEISLRSGGRYARFGLRKWRRALENSAGGALKVSVSARHGGKWITYAPFDIFVSNDTVDYGLTYRLIPPGYQSFGHMGLYERDLESFRQRTLIDTRMLESGCVNCHSENRGDPSEFCFHVRGAHSATYMRRDGVEECLDTFTDSTGGSFVYPYWHSSGNYVAFSVNSTRQSFYSSHDKLMEVYDEWSDVIVYDPRTREVLRPEATNAKDKFETMPAFSPDGRTLYYSVCDAAKMPDGIRRARYSLCAVGFDPDNGRVADKVDTLVSARDFGKSFVGVRPSYDGRYLLLTAADFGTFLIHHPEADLWLYDIKEMKAYPAGLINSDGTESFHNWSSDSKWAVVASRRDDGLYTKLYIAHFNAERGDFDKAFLLPQRNPYEYYARLPYSYNTPDFTTAPVRLDAREARKALLSPGREKVSLKED